MNKILCVVAITLLLNIQAAYAYSFHRHTITVYIADSEFKTLAFDAMNEWSVTNKVTLKAVNTKNADIAITWKHDPAANAGNTQCRLKQPDQIVKSKIWINTIRDNNRIRKAVLHELGHSIGLVDHSKNPTDIMYFQHSDLTDEHLSQEDISRLSY